ncbi:hypothetical protein DL96DRAFT_1249449 [Flagelloscypha sp. PMI_526]|nr:hypothetical protein DL96DRAFT_1249449 [Flagelloscypha sp. PMI_526]
MSSTTRVLVSGASGFLGTHIVNQLLSSGYNVRALARGSKVALLKAAYADAGERVEVFEINDISRDNFPEVFEGIDALIHSASPLAGKGEPEALINAAVEGTLNIVRQAEKGGVKKVVITGSIVSVRNPDNSLTANDWNPVTKEAALSGTLPPMGVYAASKKYAELAAWEWADAHPHVDVTLINPPYLYGALTPQLRAIIESGKPNDYSLFSTTTNVYHLLFPNGSFTASRMYGSVEDIAKLHVLALKGKPASEVGRKRFIVANPLVIDWNEALEVLKKEKPELNGRFIQGKADAPQPLPKLEYERLEEVLGFKKADFTPFETTLLATIDSLLEVEKKWMATGEELAVPPPS